MSNYQFGKRPVEGVEDILKNLDQCNDIVAYFSDKAVEAGAEWMTEKLKDAAPHDDYFTRENLEYGTLKENIRFTKHPTMDYYVVSTGDAYWGLFLELGTVGYEHKKEFGNFKSDRRHLRRKIITKQKKGIDAQPWFEPTYLENRDKLQEVIAEELKKGLNL